MYDYAIQSLRQSIPEPIQTQASTAISETDGSLSHTLGRRGIKKGKMPANQRSP